MRLVWSARLSLPPNSLPVALEILSTWLKSHQREPAYSGALEPGSVEFQSGGRLQVEQSPESGTPLAWAMRYERPLPLQGLVWISDIGFEQRDGRLEGFARLYQRSLESGRPRIDRVLVRPLGFIWEFRKRRLLTACSYQVNQIQEAEVDAFLTDIFNQQRNHLIVAVSVNPFSEKPLFDIGALQEELVGIAQVVELPKSVSLALPNTFLSRGVTKVNAKRWTAYGGAVKVYRTQASPNDNAFDHPLWLPQDVAASGFEASLKDWCWSIATLQTQSNIPDVSQLREARRDAAVSKLPSAQSLDELTAIYESDLEDERVRTDEQRQRADREQARAEELADQIRPLEAKIEALKYQLDQKLSGTAKTDVNQDSAQLDSIEEALAIARDQFAGTLIIPEDLRIDTSMDGNYWYAVLSALNDLCMHEQQGKAKNKRELLRELLKKHIGTPKDTYKVADTDVYAVDPQTGTRMHMRERVHLKEGKPAETESVYWHTVGPERSKYRYLVGSIGRHAK